MADNPALSAALDSGRPVVPVYVWDPERESPWQPGGATRWWLHGSLTALAAALAKAGAPLIVRRGSTLEELRQLASETRAGSVVWNRLYEPGSKMADAAIKKALRDEGFEAESFKAALLFEPWEIETQQGAPYQVFTPFYKACLLHGDPAKPLPAPRRLPGVRQPPMTEAIDSLSLLPTIRWDAGFADRWTPGEAGARACVAQFAGAGAAAYAKDRDQPGIAGTSSLSPHLHFGEISPRQVWHAIRAEANGGEANPYLRQLVWREFAHHLLHHFPHTPEKPLRPEFAAFPWSPNDALLRAWQKGRTGYPIVDAGMRELWSTGWMHNRVRMIAASFLVKDLLIPWQDGARWFWDTLVDADLANNTLGWQWTAGCGADAAPYFRIFNPVLQGERFDPDGAYVKRWVPELARMPARWIHKPSEAPATVLRDAGVEIGSTYPRPLVDHGAARDAALAAYDAMRRA